MNIPATTIIAAALFAIVLGAGAPTASAQAAPGASAEMSLMSTDLLAARTSAATIKAQSEQIRQQKVLAAVQAQAAAAATLVQPVGPLAPTEVLVNIPNGSGLVTGQARKTVISDFLADMSGVSGRPAEAVDIEIADRK